MGDKVFDFLNRVKIMLYSDTVVDTFLEHHGVKGQKWGVKNGPPYPLDQSYGSKKKRKEISELVDKLQKEYNADPDVYKYWAEDTIYSGQKLQSLKRIPKSERNPEKVVKQINPLYGKPGGMQNCAYCTAAFEMRCRGYDVRARHKLKPTLGNTWIKWFKGGSFSILNFKGIDSDAKQFKSAFDKKMTDKYPDGARGFLGLEYKMVHEGHLLNWVIKNRKVYLYDGQSGSILTAGDLINTKSTYFVGRLDNLKLEPSIMQASVGVYD